MLPDNPYIPHVDFFTNTEEFTYYARFYTENKTYTNLPVGTLQYLEFWKDVKDKCINGMTNSVGQSITGPHFFYLNFCPILGQNEKTGRKTKIFPKFVDLDYEYFWMVDYCRRNGKNLIAVKGRRQGWSYKGGGLVSHEYTFYPESKNIIGAFFGQYSQNTMDFALDNLNHLAATTPFGHIRNPNLRDYVMSKYEKNINGIKVWAGFQSTIECYSFKDRPGAVVGMSANWLMLEECFGKGTKILMSDRSTKNIEDIKLGEFVLRPDGSFGKVIKLNNGVDELFKIKQSNGVDYIVNSKHKLILEQRAKVPFYIDGIKLYTPEEFLNKGKYLKRTTFGIKPIESLNFKEQSIPIDPYYLGLWLGDGDKSKTNIVVNIEKDIEIKNFIYEHALKNNYKVLETICNSTTTCKKYNTHFEYYKHNPFLEFFKQENLYKNKHIPNKYLFNSEEVRLQVLAGLIDTDGWVRKKSEFNSTYYLSTSDKVLFNDYMFLIKSLGFETNYRIKPAKTAEYKGKLINSKESYQITISGNISKIPVKVERKKITNYKETTKKNLSRIEIEPVGLGKYYGITLESTKESDHWMMLEDFSIVHNCGLFPNIVDAWGYTEPLIKDGSTYTGNAVVYGSSGDMDSGSRYFYEMFTNPGKYNMLEFDDPEGGIGKIGFFSSALKGRWGKCSNPKSQFYGQLMVDKDGNSNLQAAMDDLDFERDKARNSNDPKALHAKVTQFPTSWKEAFLRNKSNVFGSADMLEWLGKLENTPSLRAESQVGELYFNSDGVLKWKPNDELHQIVDFPLKATEDTTGAITIWEHPETEENGQVPNFLYIAAADPIDQDKSETGSLGSFMVYKRFYKAGKTHDIIVAEYTGRPEKADMYYENCRRLCMYYNAKCLYENQLKGFKTYFESKNCLHYLFEQPGVIKDIIKNSSVQRSYGIHMNRGSNGNNGIKDQCEIYLKQWLYEEKADINGTKIFNYQTIKSIALLKELIAYDRDINTDRCIVLMLCILQTKELHRIHVEELSNSSSNTIQFLKNIYTKNTIFNKGKLSNAFRR